MATSRTAGQEGRVLGGRYRLLAPIGTGASARVHLADDTVLRRRVAVKVLHAALASDEAFLRRFRAEAQSAAALSHPHVMSVFDWGEDDEVAFIVMEHLAGGSLRAILDHHGRLSPSQATLAGLETARGLAYAHRRGFVHRDIKPANLLFTEEGRLCIADFGLARALAEAAWTEPAGAVLGTARYAAPEQAKGSTVDGKADVYALALVLVEAVTGRLPFAADTTIATLMARLDSPIEMPMELGPLAVALAPAGALDPTERPDATALVAALEAAARQLPRPEPIPLVGAVDVDDEPGDDVSDADRTAIGPVALFDHEATPAPAEVGRTPRAERRARRGGRRRRLWPLLLLPLLALLGGGAYLASTTLLVPSHPVPDVRGKSIDDARATATRNKLRVRVAERRYDETVPDGVVLAQRPARGREQKEDQPIALTVSRGPPPRAVPDLAGFDEDAARAAIEQAGLVVGEIEPRNDEDAPKGRVLDWAPKDGEVAKGSPVILVVSAGPAPRTIPNVVGATFEDAVAALADVQLKATRVDVFSDSAAAGTVVSTAPASGRSAARGSTVQVNVSKGPDLVTVPQVIGERLDDAIRILNEAGLTVSSVFGPGGGRDFKKRVVLTDPVAGTRVKRGSGVNIYVR